MSQDISKEQFAEMFRCKEDDLLPETLKSLAEANASHRLPTQNETEEYIHHCLKLIKSDWIQRTREENKRAWLRGWSEHLNILREQGVSNEIFKPKYFRGSKFLRLNRGIVVSQNHQIEHDLFTVVRTHLFKKYLSEIEAIYELGCGSCQNLWMLSELFPQKKIHGYDWVEPCVEIANTIGKTGKKVSGSLLDMLDPKENLSLSPNSAIITIHALEQIEDKHEKLLKCIIDAKPEIVVHYEPIVEFYDEDNLYDSLAKWYIQKRKYLKGLIPALEKLQQQKKIEILDAYRPGLGGVVHEASVVVWRLK